MHELNKTNIRSVNNGLFTKQSLPLLLLCCLLGLLSIALTIILVVFYTQQEACHGIKCYQKCEIKQDCEDINWRAKV